MAIKKVILLVSLIVFITSIGFAITNNNVSEKKTETKTEIKKVPQDTALKKAKNYYLEGDFDKAEEYIEQILVEFADNEKANELKNKILLLKEKEIYYKRNLTNDYLIELRRTVKDGNYYEGFWYIEQIKKLSPDENVKNFYNRLSSEKEIVLYTLESSKDKKIFLDSIDLFVEGKFSKTTDLIYKLYKKYPKFVDYVGMCRYYCIKENNYKRVDALYKKAIKSFKETRLGDARNYAEMCYSLNPDDIRLKILIDQINMEII